MTGDELMRINIDGNLLDLLGPVTLLLDRQISTSWEEMGDIREPAGVFSTLQSGFLPHE